MSCDDDDDFHDEEKAAADAGDDDDVDNGVHGAWCTSISHVCFRQGLPARCQKTFVKYLTPNHERTER